MFSDASAKDLIGKHILVGITSEDHLHQRLNQEQFHGRVIHVTEEDGIVIQTASGMTRALPPDLRSIYGARPGHYTLRSTGEVVTDPEVQTIWTVTKAPPEA